MTQIGKAFCLVASVALWQGCSSSSDNGDASTTDAGADVAADASTVFLSRGMNYYKVTAVSGVTDGCDIGASTFLNEVLPVTFVQDTQILSVGNPKGVPVQSSLGSGMVGVTGTLNRENDVTDGACSWHQKDVSLFVLTGGDVFTLDVTENQSAFTVGCGLNSPPCMSTYKLTFEKTTAPVDGGI